MPNRTHSLPRFLLEDYLSLLRTLVLIAWLGMGCMAITELLVRGVLYLDWPQQAGFAQTYHLILLEFTINTLVLTLLLFFRDWYERLPRAAEPRVRWLVIFVLIWLGLHLFAAFHVTGSLSGPLLPLLPLVLFAALVSLPGKEGWLLCGYLLAGHLAVVLLESRQLIHSPGLLADHFDLSHPSSPLGAFTLLGILVLAIVFAVIIRGRLLLPQAERITASHRIDPDTGLYRRSFLVERMTSELARLRRHGGHDALLLLSLESPTANQLTESELRAAAKIVIRHVRTHMDTPARFGPSILGILLPAVDADMARDISLRTADVLSCSELQVNIRAAAAITDGAGVEPAQLIAAAHSALRNAKPCGETVVITLSNTTSAG